MEDFATIFILLLLPGFVLANNQLPLAEFGWLAIKGLLLLGLILGFGWKIAPRLIDKMSRSDQEYKETAFLLALSFGFIFALLSSYLGFSPAIGAFLMGLMISGKHAKFVLEKIGPVKDLFIVLFFVSMGTLINVGSLISLTLPLLAVLGTAIAGKFFGCWLGTRFFISKQEAGRVGISMLPRGEFSFIVAREGLGTGIAFQLLYPLAGLTTLISSILASVGLRLVRKQEKIPVLVEARHSHPKLRFHRRTGPRK
jgi:CPA2 family monovalent cation:H+ antiporter-2